MSAEEQAATPSPAARPKPARRYGVPLVVHFQFRLAPGASVGPALLQQIWATASASSPVAVSRAARHNADGFVYSLSAPSNLENIAAVETRLRVLLTRHLVGAVNTLVRLPG